MWILPVSLWWRHNGHDGVSNHQPHHCLHKRLFRRRSKKPSKLRVTGLCAGNSSVAGEFPAQMASNAENVSIRWRHHVYGDNPLPLVRPYSCPSPSEIILKDMDSKTQNANPVYISWDISYLHNATILLGLPSLRKHHLIGIGIPIIKRRWSSDPHRFIMGTFLPVRTCLFNE